MYKFSLHGVKVYPRFTQLLNNQLQHFSKLKDRSDKIEDMAVTSETIGNLGK